jgi:outer membrane protein OmpA-like peptidoglycan-associated protein/tetratricopeptide (TPR) repeat protein
MQKTLCICSLFLLALSTAAQNYDPSKINKKAVALYNQAIERASDNQYPTAVGLLQQAIDLDAGYVDAWLSLAGVYGQIKSYKAAVEKYEKAFTLDSVYTSEYKLPYSINLAGMGEFEKALAAVNSLLSSSRINLNTKKAAEYRKKSYEFAVDYASKNDLKSYVFAPQNLGEAINSSESEYFPSMTLDGSEMIFTRRIKGYNEDFFSSRFTNNSWETAKTLGAPVNTPQNEGAQIIAQDGQWLVFTGCNRPDGFGSCDLYISYQTGEGWSEASNLGGTVNSDQWESQPCLSPDKKELYFASRRFGGLGGSDIYVCRLQSNGKWSSPENLGPSINTNGDEQCPFIHADNQTLYFTSNKWPGYGDDDLFYSRKGPNNSWSNPINLGYPINTISREGTLFIAANGITAYYASDRNDSRGGLDIYSFELREKVRPYKTLWVKGQVTDKKTKKGLPSNVELVELTTGLPFSKVQTDETGHYLMTLPVGKDYVFTVGRKGYLFYSDNFLLSQRSPDSTYEKNIALTPIESGAVVVLNNIFFDFNKFILKNESQAELDKLVQLMTENPTVKIEISGHTDSVGKAADNLKLSQNRAKAVVAYLVNKKIAAARLSFKGYGATRPVAPNKTEEGRARNRRTEMKVISQ